MATSTGNTWRRVIYRYILAAIFVVLTWGAYFSVRLYFDFALSTLLLHAVLLNAILLSAFFCGTGPTLFTTGIAALSIPLISHPILNEIPFSLSVDFEGSLIILELGLLITLLMVSKEVLIKENKKQKKIHELGAIFQKLIHRAPIGIVFIGEDRELKYVNDKCLKILGCSFKDFKKNQMPWSLIDPLVQQRPHHEPLKNIDSENPITYETEILRQDGTLIPVSLSIFSADHGIAFFITDQTLEKKVQLELAKSREEFKALAEKAVIGRNQFEAVLEYAAQVIMVFDIEGKLLWLNSAAIKLYGFQSKQEALFHLKEYDEVFETRHANGDRIPIEDWPVHRALMGETVTHFEMEVLRKDTKKGWVATISAAPIRNSKNEIIQAVVTINEITARKKAEVELQRVVKQLADERKLFNAVIEQLPVAVAVAKAPNGKLILGNDTFTAIWKKPFKFIEMDNYSIEWKGTFEDGTPVANRDWPMSHALRGNRIENQVICIHRDDGSIAITEQSASPVYDELGNIVAGVITFIDITERKKTEADREKAIRSRDEVLAIVSHDLRNPLSIVELNAALLDNPISAKPTENFVHSRVEAIKQAVHRMNSLIQDLLDISQIESERLQPDMTLNETQQIIEDSVNSFQILAAAKGIKMEYQIECPHLKVLCDRDRIGQVFSNLIGNALKFTPTGTGIIRVGCKLKADSILFYVADNGIGIPPEQLPHVFDRFWQAKHSKKAGVGLGLAIAKGILTAQRGEIWLESTLNQGTTFYFTLPIARDQSTQIKAS